MALRFDDKAGLQAENTAVIRARRADEWQHVFAVDASLPPLNVEPETPAGQLIDGETALIAEKDAQMLYLANMFNPKTATGRWQDALAKIYFIDRHIGEPTYVTCQVTGRYGTIIPYGALVQSTDGYTFINTAVSTIGANGRGEIIVRCAELGPVEVAAGSVTKIVTTVPGWDTVNNEAAGVIGRDEENQADFEQRRADSVAKNSHGAVASLFGEISNVDNVVACKVIENTTCNWIEKYGVRIPGHSVYISVYGGDDADIARAIYHKLDAGCGMVGSVALTFVPGENEDDEPGAVYTYYINRPATKKTGITVTIRKTPTTPSNVAALIKMAVVKNFTGQNGLDTRVRMATTLYSSRFYKSVTGAGVEDLVNVKLHYPAGGAAQDSIEIPANELPTLDEDSVKVIIQEV